LLSAESPRLYKTSVTLHRKAWSVDGGLLHEGAQNRGVHFRNRDDILGKVYFNLSLFCWFFLDSHNFCKILFWFRRIYSTFNALFLFGFCYVLILCFLNTELLRLLQNIKISRTQKIKKILKQKTLIQFCPMLRIMLIFQ
jgi:hypothetical protein